MSRDTGEEPGEGIDPRDAQLDSGHLVEDLRRRTTRSVAVSVTFRSTRAFVHLAGLAVLARLLTPEDYGLIAIVVVITGLGALFSDFGMSAATIQRPRLLHREINTVFWFNVAMGVLAGVLVAVAAPVLAAVYDDPRLAPVALALAFTFPVGGLAAQHRALLNRQMLFSRLVAIELSAAVLSLGVGITAAVLGAGYWALVAVSLADLAIQVPLLWWASAWRPSSPRERTEVREILAFGGYMSAYQVIAYALRRLDDLLIGWKFGAAALGLYTRAYSLLMLPIVQINTPLTSVMLPALSRVQGDEPRLARGYLRAVRVLAWLTFPFVASLIVCADELVPLVLGNSWSGAIPLFQIFGVSAALQPIASTSTWLLMSGGRPDRMLRWSLISSCVRVPGFFAALQLDVTAFAVFHSAASALLFVPCIWFATRNASMRTLDVLSVIKWPMAVGASVVAASFGVWAAMPRLSTMLIAAVVTAAMIAVGLVASGDWREIRSLAADLKARKLAS